MIFVKQRSPYWIWFSYLIVGEAQAKVRKGVMSEQKILLTSQTFLSGLL